MSTSIAGANVAQHEEYTTAPFEPNLGRGTGSDLTFQQSMTNIFGDKLAVVPTMAYDLVS